MNNKKSLMVFSAFCILIFHLWINITNTALENYLKQMCIIGVDIMFFVSAYSLSKRNNFSYKEFLVNRFTNVYLKFMLFTILGFIYFKWSISKFLLTAFGIDLFLSGGGSFLWFIPGIMILYLLMPLYMHFDHLNTKRSIVIGIVIFLLFTVGISLLTDYTEIFILTNRLPIVFIGYYFGKYDLINRLSLKKYFGLGITLLMIGNCFSYLNFVRGFRLTWFEDVFYIINIPLELAIIMFIDKLQVNKFISLVGSLTLELYGVQMLFGFKIANYIYKAIEVPIMANICSISIIIVISFILKRVFDYGCNIKELRLL